MPGAGSGGERSGEISWRGSRDGRRFDVLVVGKAQDAVHDAGGDAVCLLGEDFAVEVEEAGLDDGGDGAGVNFAEGVILAHVAGDAAGVEGEVRGALVAVHQAGGETVGAVGVGGVERRGNFEAGGFVVDVFAGIVVDGNNGEGAVAVETGVELTQQVHLIARFDQFLLDDCRNLEVDIRLCKRDLTVSVHAHGARVIAGVSGDDANAQLRLGGGRGSIHRAGGEDDAQAAVKIAGDQSARGKGGEQGRQQNGNAKNGLQNAKRAPARALPPGRAGMRCGFHAAPDGTFETGRRQEFGGSVLETRLHETGSGMSANLR